MLSVKSIYPKDRIAYRLINEVKPCSAGFLLGWVTECEYPV